MAQSTGNPELDKALAEEIKEFHFHVYFFQDNADWVKSAEEMIRKINELVEAGFFKVAVEHFYKKPDGPHVIGSFEIWCPKEYFSRLYSWLLLHRGKHSVLVHPLTRLELLDHTDRAAFMGPSIPMDLKILVPSLPDPPANPSPSWDPRDYWVQHAEFKLGYSALEDQ